MGKNAAVKVGLLLMIPVIVAAFLWGDDAERAFGPIVHLFGFGAIFGCIWFAGHIVEWLKRDD